MAPRKDRAHGPKIAEHPRCMANATSRGVRTSSVGRISPLALVGVERGSSGFRMGRLDHVHIRVPDRMEAARWYAEHLGFEPVSAYDFWATGFQGGPLQISADGGQTTLALFEASESHPMLPHETGVAFSVDADAFISFARSLPCGIDAPGGAPLTLADIVDFDLCWAFNLADPWGNQYELNCYDYRRVQAELVEIESIDAIRYWPRELYPRYLDSTSSSSQSQGHPTDSDSGRRPA
jgi:catechol 2,3-dioxygenase-like lactoylglutathione lyase family enzyme